MIQKMFSVSLNKHCEILVSCSDKERNCMKLHASSWNVELHVSSLNFMKVQGTACKLRELHVNSCDYMQAYVTACKLM